MATTVRFTKARRAIFLEVLGDTGIVTQACARSGLARRTAYHRRDKDGSFAEA